jgi:carbon-monoxide dehydrogenase medium subunit
MMAMRLARPSRLIDIARIDALHCIREESNAIVVGAATRQATAAASATIAMKVPLLAAALPYVGHAATRARGTVGGSVANADPASEIPLVLTTLAGWIVLRDRSGSSGIAADDLFLGPMMTAAPRDACIIEICFPVWQVPRIGVGFQEISARRSDFALVAAAAQIALDEGGRCTACVFGIGGASAAPQRYDSVAGSLIGSHLSDDEIANAAYAAADEIEIMSSPHASDAYRRRAAATLGARALMQARNDAMRFGAPS